MFVRIGARDRADFEHPMALLAACHRRVEHFLGELLLVSARLQGGALDETHHTALAGALEYFEVAAPRHTEDEEASLFPRLLAALDARAAERDAIGRLEAEHRRLEPIHAEVHRLARLALAEGALPGAEARRMRALAEQLCAVYAEHIRLEEDQVFPLAAHLLSPAQLAEIGQEMAERRAR